MAHLSHRFASLLSKMERDTNFTFSAGQTFTSGHFPDDDMNSGISLQSLLAMGVFPFTPLPAAEFCFSSEPSSLGFSSATLLNLLGDGFPAFNQPFVFDNEPPESNESSHLFNFISRASEESSIFNHLPDLHSLEHSSESPSAKRVRFDSATHSKTPASRVQPSLRFPLSVNKFSHPDTPVPARSAVTTQSLMARQRRQKISDKLRCLQRLMPWNKKMDNATMLEEVYKYVKFLQAQVMALQSMPCETSFFVNPPSIYGGTVGSSSGGALRSLERLNRQQLLEVLVNSPMAQSVLYAKGWCVFSVEQLVLAKIAHAEHRAALQQLEMFDPFNYKLP